jgi:hypothetical protein
MSKPEAKESANTQPQKKFSEMSSSEKLKHIGKVCIFLITMGFIFPTLFSD